MEVGEKSRWLRYNEFLVAYVFRRDYIRKNDSFVYLSKVMVKYKPYKNIVILDIKSFVLLKLLTLQHKTLFNKEPSFMYQAKTPLNRIR